MKERRDMQRESACPVCGDHRVEEFLRRPVAPVHQNLLCSSTVEARLLACGALHMHVCTQCGFVFNAAFDESLLAYGQQYDNTQTYSATFQDHVGQLVDRLARLPSVRRGTVVEVGCGKGGFLRQLLNVAGSGCQGHGFDPAYEGVDSDLNGRLTFHRCFYDEQQADLSADVIVCRHVIEHIPQPLSILRSVRRACRPGARIFFETPCARWILENQVVWDFFYEHCSLFTPESLTMAFERAGFDVESVEHVFGGQYLWLEAVGREQTGTVAMAGEASDGFSDFAPQGEAESDEMPAILPFRAHRGDGDGDGDGGRDMPRLARKFAACEGSLVEQWRRRIKALARQGGVVLWGGGAKGVTFANLVDPDRRLIAGVVDVNPNKQGRFVPGSAHRILAPEALSGLPVRSAVLLNPNYASEVVALLQRLRLNVSVIDLMNMPAASAAA